MATRYPPLAFVYLAQVQGTPYFKIGQSSNPPLRVRQIVWAIRRGQPDVLTPVPIFELLQTVRLTIRLLWGPFTRADAMATERRMMTDLFRPFHILLQEGGNYLKGGEWFEMSEEVVNYFAVTTHAMTRKTPR